MAGLLTSTRLTGGDLPAWLEAQADCAWIWGARDCTLFAADWVWAVRGEDPASAWRGRYRSALSCERRLRAAGGLISVMDAALGPLGITRTAAPRTGDVAAIALETTDATGRVAVRPTAAIRMVTRWAVFATDGVRVVRADALAAWRV